jgi:hypothetical protein
VQVRKIKDEATSASCEIELIAYSRTISTPLIFVGVDVKNERAYWRHVTNPMVELKEGKQSCTLRFDPISDTIGEGFPYFERWGDLAKEYQKRVSNYPQLKKQLSDAVRLTSVAPQDIMWFQTFVDLLNRYWNEDFPGLKDLFFSDTWKIGVAITSTTPHHLSYSLYKVPKGENAPLIISAPGEMGHLFGSGPNVRSIETGGIPFSGKYISRQSIDTPEAKAKNEIAWYASKLFEHRSLKLSGELICSEYIFRFLDQFHHVMGVDLKDDYEIGELRRGLYGYFPHWYFFTFRKFSEMYADILPNLAYPTFSMIARSIVRISKEEIENKMSSGAPFYSYVIPDDERHLRSLKEALDYMFQKGVERIRRPYASRAQVGRWIWNGFTVVELRQNLSTVFQHLHQEYREFVEANGFDSRKLIHCATNFARLYVANLETWPNSEGCPFIKYYVVENNDGMLPPVQFIDAASSSEPAMTDSRKRLICDNAEYQLLAWGSYGATTLFGKAPLLNTCYRWLAEDLSKELNHQFSIRDR